MSGHLREWRRDRYRTGQHSTNDVHTSLEKKNNCDFVNHQHFRLVSSTKVKIDLVIVFIYKDPFSSRLTLRFHLGELSAAGISSRGHCQKNQVSLLSSKFGCSAALISQISLCS